MGKPLSTLSRRPVGFKLSFAPDDEWPGETYFARHRKTLVGIESGATPSSAHIDEDDESDGDDSAQEWPTANHHQLVKLRERLLKTCGTARGLLSCCINDVYSDLCMHSTVVMCIHATILFFIKQFLSTNQFYGRSELAVPRACASVPISHNSESVTYYVVIQVHTCAHILLS